MPFFSTEAFLVSIAELQRAENDFSSLTIRKMHTQGKEVEDLYIQFFFHDDKFTMSDESHSSKEV